MIGWYFGDRSQTAEADREVHPGEAAVELLAGERRLVSGRVGARRRAARRRGGSPRRGRRRRGARGRSSTCPGRYSARSRRTRSAAATWGHVNTLRWTNDPDQPVIDLRTRRPARWSPPRHGRTCDAEPVVGQGGGWAGGTTRAWGRRAVAAVGARRGKTNRSSRRGAVRTAAVRRFACRRDQPRRAGLRLASVDIRLEMFALWPVLLPFSLVNVSGLDASRYGRRRRTGPTIAASRSCRVLLGYTVTVASVLWLLLAGQVVAMRRGTLDGAMVERMPFPDDVTRFWIGTAGAGLAVLVVLVASVHVGRGFGRFRVDPTAPVHHDGTCGRGRCRTSDRTCSSMPIDDTRALAAARSPRPLSPASASSVYVVAGGTAEPFEPFADVCRGGRRDPARAARRRGTADVRRPGWWLLSGVGTAAIGVMLVAGLTVSALMLSPTSMPCPAGRLMMTFDAYGFAVGAGILVGAGFACSGCCRHSERSPRRPRPSGAARRRAKTRPPQRRRRPGRGHRSRVDLRRDAAVLFIVRSSRDDAESWTLTNTPPVTLGSGDAARVAHVHGPQPDQGAGQPGIVAASRDGVGRGRVLAAARSTPSRCVCYAERAVPELRLLLTRGGWDGGLQVTADSQGAVLVHAALLPRSPPLAPHARRPPRRRSFTGRGRRPRDVRFAAADDLHPRLPALLRPADIAAVRGLLHGRWRNVFRYTDHIGRAMFGDTQPPDPGRHRPRRPGSRDPPRSPATTAIGDGEVFVRDGPETSVGLVQPALSPLALPATTTTGRAPRSSLMVHDFASATNSRSDR